MQALSLIFCFAMCVVQLGGMDYMHKEMMRIAENIFYLTKISRSSPKNSGIELRNKQMKEVAVQGVL